MNQPIQQNDKKRNMIIFMALIATVALLGGAYVFTRSNNTNKTAGPVISTASNPNISTAPGNSTSREYNLEVKTENEKKAREALEQGKSFEPRIVNNDVLAGGSPIDALQNNAKKVQAQPEPVIKPVEIVVQEADKAPVPVVTTVPTINTSMAQPVVATPVVAAKPAPRYSADQYALIGALRGVYTDRHTGIETDYTQTNRNGNSGSNNGATNVASNTANPNSSTTAQEETTALMKAGDMINAVLETEINSDEPSPVLARIVGGKMNGGKAVCSIQRNGEKALVECKKLNLPNMPKSIGVNLVAIDPTTTRSGLATSVDRHYFEKYVVGLGAAFLKGYADALLRQNTTTSVSALGSVTVATGALDSGTITKQGVGEVGRTLAQQTSQNTANLKPTVKVSAGTAIGLMATDDILIK